MDETTLYHNDPETKKQSMEWKHSGSPRHNSKNYECKNLLEKFSTRFLGSRGHAAHYVTGPNFQLGVLLISTGVIEGLLKEKRPR
jgi:hypothetical protein